MSMEIRVGIESTRIEQIFWTSSSWYRILIIASMSFVFAEQSDFWSRFFIIAHKLSIGFCWKIPFPSANDCCIDGTNFVSNISWYLVEFIIPSIGHNLPVPFNVKHPQNIFFGGCFGACWMWKLLRGSPALRLTYCDLWPCISKWLSSENTTFLHSSFLQCLYLFLTKLNVSFS